MNLFRLLFIAAIALPIADAEAISIGICQTLQECQAMCTSGRYCCPTGQNKTVSSCPSGWLLNLAGTSCTRAATNNLSDSTGYYTQNYGSCSPTTRQVACYTVSSNDEVYINGALAKCMFCINAGDL